MFGVHLWASYLHPIQPVHSQGYTLISSTGCTCYLHRCIFYLTARLRANMQHVSSTAPTDWASSIWLKKKIQHSMMKHYVLFYADYFQTENFAEKPGEWRKYVFSSSLIHIRRVNLFHSLLHVCMLLRGHMMRHLCISSRTIIFDDIHRICTTVTLLGPSLAQGPPLRAPLSAHTLYNNSSVA